MVTARLFSEDSIVAIDCEDYSGRASEGKNALIVARVQGIAGGGHALASPI